MPNDATGLKRWHPSYAAVRKSERFKTLMRANGLVDYWRARGWPNLCPPQGADLCLNMATTSLFPSPWGTAAL